MSLAAAQFLLLVSPSEGESHASDENLRFVNADV